MSMRILMALPLLAFGLSGCFFVSDDDAARPARGALTGALVVDWTIDGALDADECDQGDVDRLHLVVYRTSGQVIGDFADLLDARRAGRR